MPNGDDTGAAKTPELVFYYSRSRRLEKASEAVRRMNDLSPVPRQGLFRTLVATKSRALLFISIMLISAAILVMSLLDTGGSTGGITGGSTGGTTGAVLGGNRLVFSAMNYGDAAFIVIKKTAQETDAYTGIVDMGVSIPLTKEAESRGAAAPAEFMRIVFTGEAEEDFRFQVPFTGEELLISMRAGENRLNYRIKPP
ncbi:MAG: hypothetical protein LBG76_07290 [Treponema sp.]|jgi:hypothetical protein|nr:hypothetical protein [Treponema sp.]